MADITVTAANVKAGANAVVKTVTAGVAINAGQVVYQDTSDKKYKLADADALATAKVAGIALNDAATDQPLEVQTAGDIDVGGTVVVGEVYLVSVTAGGIAPEADVLTGDYVSILGIGTVSNKLKMQILISDIAIP